MRDKDLGLKIEKECQKLVWYLLTLQKCPRICPLTVEQSLRDSSQRSSRWQTFKLFDDHFEELKDRISQYSSISMTMKAFTTVSNVKILLTTAIILIHIRICITSHAGIHNLHGSSHVHLLTQVGLTLAWFNHLDHTPAMNTHWAKFHSNESGPRCWFDWIIKNRINYWDTYHFQKKEKKRNASKWNYWDIFNFSHNDRSMVNINGFWSYKYGTMDQQKAITRNKHVYDSFFVSHHMQ